MRYRAISLLVFLAVSASMAPAADISPCKVKKPKVLSDCTKIGCANPGKPKAIFNTQKRTLPPSGTPKTLSFDDFRSLQTQAETLFPKFHTLAATDRMRLRNLKIGGQKVGEGSLVQVVGYISVRPPKPGPHANTGESVNCNLKTAVNNDYHISIVPSLDTSEFLSIVVELIPQNRDPAMTEAAMQDVQDKKRLVRVRGQLFFDNEHYVNDDEHHPKGKQPKRRSLWEIHPVTQFDICKQQTCTIGGSGWESLRIWK